MLQAVSFVEPSFFLNDKFLFRRFCNSLIRLLFYYFQSYFHVSIFWKFSFPKQHKLNAFLFGLKKIKIGFLLVVSTLSPRVSWGEGSVSERLAMQVWGTEFGFPDPIKLWKQCHGSVIPVSILPSTLLIIQQNMVWLHRTSLQGTNE